MLLFFLIYLDPEIFNFECFIYSSNTQTSIIYSKRVAMSEKAAKQGAGRPSGT